MIGGYAINIITVFALLFSSTVCGLVYEQCQISEAFISAECPSTAQELEQYRIIAVSSPEDFEDFFAEGYPNEDLLLILEDESIPEEDRYWLDCRIRSAAAQLLHRFYDEQGNPIDIEADWIKPGEDYWQEVLIANAAGELENINTSGPSFHFPVESGILYNLYGQEIGTTAAASKFIRLSRNGSVGVVQTGSRSRMGGGNMFFCFLYPDGSFHEVEFTDTSILSERNMALSQDGSISAWLICDRGDYNVASIHVYDAGRDEIESYDIPFVASRIAISPNNRYIAYSMLENGSGIIDRNSGNQLNFAMGSGRMPRFSDNSDFCALAEGNMEGYSPIVDLNTQSSFYIANERVLVTGARGFGDISISNDGQIIIAGGQVFSEGISIVASDQFRSNSISPNGYFCMLDDLGSNWYLGFQNAFALFSFRDLKTID